MTDIIMDAPSPTARVCGGRPEVHLNSWTLAELCRQATPQVPQAACSYCSDASLRQWPGRRRSYCLHESKLQYAPSSVRPTSAGVFEVSHASGCHVRAGQSATKLMDLVYPPAAPPPYTQLQSHRSIVTDTGGLLKRPCSSRTHHNVITKPPLQAKGHATTWLVGEQGEWRKRRSPCMCQHAECPGLSSQQGLAYIAVKLIKLGNRMERYFDCRTKHELHLGKPVVDQKCGLKLSESAHAALSLLGNAKLKDHDVVVLRGVASGMGCRHGPVIYAPIFRPVCAMDYIVTKY